MHRIEKLHESMDGSLQLLGELPVDQRSGGAVAIVHAIERDLGVERRLLTQLDIRIPGLTGVDPLATLQQGDMDRLLVQLKERGEPDERRWDAALVELRLQLDTAFVAVDLALSERS